MRIEFDPAKDAANIAKHGVSLTEAASLDLTSAAVVADDRRDYGEPRYRAFNRIDGQGFCLVFTNRGDVVRVISFRRAHEGEMRRYLPLTKDPPGTWGVTEPMTAPYDHKPAVEIGDDENPEWTEADFARARPGSEVLPPEVLALFGKPRGRPKSEAPKVAVKLRLDPDVLAAFKATGAGWQTRINATLRDAAERMQNPVPRERDRGAG